MAASHMDSYVLSQDSKFQNRVQAALVTAFVSIANEGWNVIFHRERALFVVQALSSTSALAGAVTLFSFSVSTDANVLSDATQAGTVALTTANADAQQALVTDAHIDSAISSQFNAFCKEPAF